MLLNNIKFYPTLFVLTQMLLKETFGITRRSSGNCGNFRIFREKADKLYMKAAIIICFISIIGLIVGVNLMNRTGSDAPAADVSQTNDVPH